MFNRKRNAPSFARVEHHKLTKLQNEVDELKQLMQRNLEKALGNLESLREAERASKAL